MPINELLVSLNKAMAESSQMVVIALAAAIALGIPLGLMLFLTSQELVFESKFRNMNKYLNNIINTVGGTLVNVIRSVPFVILLVLLLPLTELVTGTTIGSIAASVPLSVASIAFYARLVEGSFREVDKGVIEAAIASGATKEMLITDVLLVEARPGLIRGFTVTAVSLIGYSAMAGIVGGGGIGDLAIRFGYYRYETSVMIVTVVVLVLIVQLFQIIGDRHSENLDKR